MTLNDMRYRQILLACILLGAALRLTGLNWDEGRGLHPDEGNLIRAALTLSVPGRMIPDFHAYNDLALWLPRAVAWPFCTQRDGVCLTWAARLVSALFSVATIPIAASLSRALAGPLAGVAAAALFAISAPLVQWAHFGTTESALVFLVVALWALAAHRLIGGLADHRFALWTGALLGVGFGFKTTALVLAAIPVLTLALLGFPDRRRLRVVGMGMALTTLLALLSAPSIWAAPAAWLEVMHFENGVVTGTLPVFWTAQFDAAVNGSYELGQLWHALSGAGLLLALAGIALLPTPQRRAALPGLGFALIYAALTFGWHAKFFRYLAPLIPVLLIFAAVAVGRMLAAGKSQSTAAFGIFGLCVMGLAGVDQAAIYLKTDPRLLAESALLRLAGPDDVVAIEPHDTGQVGGFATTVLPLSDQPGDRNSIAKTLAGSDWVLIASRRNWAVLPQSDLKICAYYTSLAEGSLGFALSGRFGRNGPFGKLFAPGISAEETRAVFDRPEVLLLQNIERLSEDDISARLSNPVAPERCAPAALAAQFKRVQ